MVHPVQSANNIICYTILVLLIAGCGSVTQPDIAKNMISNADKNLNRKNGVVYLGEKPFTGKIYSLYPNTKDTAEITGYNAGREHGIWKEFFANGLLKEKREFRDGLKTGEFLAWWENGKQRLAYNFINDEYEGTCREWNPDGLLVKEMNYKRGHEEGPQQWWYDNGKIKANYVIADGRRFGLLGTKNCINVSDSIFKN
jgi:antitoxin component YwqK of YwqJK toxin-antitoxin module